MLTGLMIAAAILSGCAHKGDPELFPPQQGAPTVDIYVINHRVHTGIALPKASLPQVSILEKALFRQFSQLEFGWGDRDYYQDPSNSLWLGIKALLWPTDSVMHVVGFAGPANKEFPRSNSVRLRLSEAGFLRLVSFIANTFARRDGKRAESLGTGLYGESLFFPAVGTFHLFNNCNVWVSHALQSAGLPISTSLTASGVISSVAAFSL